ncbi:hypothetical protein Tco_0547314, partial [Tanacetum coccineum]
MLCLAFPPWRGVIGGIPDNGASDLVGESMKGGGNGSEWEVDTASALSRIIAAIEH